MTEAKYLEIKTITSPHNIWLETKEMHKLCANGGLYRIVKNEDRIHPFVLEELREMNAYYYLSEKDYVTFIPDESEFGWVITYDGLLRLCNDEGFILFIDDKIKVVPYGKPENHLNESLTEMERNQQSIEEMNRVIELFKKHRKEKKAKLREKFEEGSSLS